MFCVLTVHTELQNMSSKLTNNTASQTAADKKKLLAELTVAHSLTRMCTYFADSITSRLVNNNWTRNQ